MSENLVEDWLRTPIPKKLWHYTSIKGFQGIVSSKRIHATDLRFLNDRTEFVHAQNIAQNVIDEAVEKDENGWQLKDNLQHIVSQLFGSGTLSFERLQVFTASFSLAEDQLSQWRGYSRASSGVSLGFDLRGLRPPSTLGTLVTFAPCVYSDEKKIELITYVLYKFARDASSLWKQLGDQSVMAEHLSVLRQAHPNLTFEEAVEQLRADRKEWYESELRRAGTIATAEMLRLAGLLKDSSFEEEKEWRLVLPVFTAKPPQRYPRQFRSGATALTPYIEFPFSAEGNDPVPLTDLILGPGSAPSPATVDSAHSFLVSEGINVMPRESRVPFRPS